MSSPSLTLRVVAAATVSLGLLAPVASLPASAATTVGGPLLATHGVAVQASKATRPLPRLSAASFVLADATTGEILAARNPHGRFRPASTLKTLTAVTLLPLLDPSTEYTATWDDANVEGSKVGVVPKGTYTVRNLFEGMFLISGNDAANALATAAGGVPRTVELMNAKAKELGALDTHVVNPSGLDADGQYTSAYDLALFAREGLARDDFRTYAGTVHSTFPGKPVPPGHRRPTFQIWTQNKLLMNYHGAIGTKTGWTTLARGTFSGAATRNGRTLIATVMHTGPRAWKESAALLDWGFANAATVTPVGTLEQPKVVAQAAPAAHRPPLAATPRQVGHADGVPLWAWPLLAAVGALAAMRTRVLVLRRLRPRQRYSLPPL